MPQSLRSVGRCGFGFVWLALCGLLAGCGDGGPKLYPVTGKVTVGGKPLTSGTVVYNPEKSNSFTGICVGELNGEGVYTLNTRGKPGAPAGAYKVTISSTGPVSQDNTKPPTKSLINTGYSLVETTNLETTVGDNPGKYDFEVTP
ncbi:MAG TPA: hypothetical protein VN641_02130 [Urbifossiella sp.]|nr:hypothetical protein [Urbifossiella sp.]